MQLVKGHFLTSKKVCFLAFLGFFSTDPPSILVWHFFSVLIFSSFLNIYVKNGVFYLFLHHQSRLDFQQKHTFFWKKWHFMVILGGLKMTLKWTSRVALPKIGLKKYYLIKGVKMVIFGVFRKNCIFLKKWIFN